MAVVFPCSPYRHVDELWHNHYSGRRHAHYGLLLRDLDKREYDTESSLQRLHIRWGLCSCGNRPL